MSLLPFEYLVVQHSPLMSAFKNWYCIVLEGLLAHVTGGHRWLKPPFIGLSVTSLTSGPDVYGSYLGEWQPEVRNRWNILALHESRKHGRCPVRSHKHTRHAINSHHDVIPMLSHDTLKPTQALRRSTFSSNRTWNTHSLLSCNQTPLKIQSKYYEPPPGERLCNKVKCIKDDAALSTIQRITSLCAHAMGAGGHADEICGSTSSKSD